MAFDAIGANWCPCITAPPVQCRCPRYALQPQTRLLPRHRPRLRARAKNARQQLELCHVSVSGSYRGTTIVAEKNNDRRRVHMPPKPPESPEPNIPERVPCVQSAKV